MCGSSFYKRMTCLCFVSTGTKVEGILRQSADVEEVDRRVQEYEQGLSCTFCWSVSHFFLTCYIAAFSNYNVMVLYETAPNANSKAESFPSQS